MRSRGQVPNRGGGPTRHRASEGRATCVLSGPLRFVDRPAERAAMRVEDGNALGRRFVGQTVTLTATVAPAAANTGASTAGSSLVAREMQPRLSGAELDGVT